MTRGLRRNINMYICEEMPKSLSSEAYKSVRTSLKYASVDKELKTIVVTSSVPGEGKSTVSGNLAICFADSGNKVLIIDCDLRRPTLHKKFGLSNVHGLTDILLDPSKLAKGIKKYNDKLSLISAGTIPPNPSEMLGTKAFSKLLEVLKEKFDYIILDTPPVLAVTDAKVVAAKADATVFVVRYGKTKEKIIVKAFDELKKVNANVVGSVMNICDRKKRDSYYYYYGQKKGLFGRHSHHHHHSQKEKEKFESAM